MDNSRLRALSCMLAASVLTIAGGCSSTPAVTAPASGPVAYPAVDTALGERLFPNEAAIGSAIADDIERSLRQQYPAGAVRRDVHPKAHGCVRAEFRVRDALPPMLAQGIFIPGKSWPALIRFSNGSRDSTRADSKRDARGMAIKVLGVPSPKLLEDEADAETQDFILINYPVFFASDPGRYLKLLEASTSDNFLRKLTLPFVLGFRGDLIAWHTVNQPVANPLQLRYWSMVPSQLGTGPGRQAVKYSVRPCQAVSEKPPRHPGHDFLREALRNSLQQGGACMEFMVQPRTSPRLSVEDATQEWPEREAPFYPVATLRIPRQEFDTPAQNAACENLSFSPWHALPEHKPLGVTNRLRKVIYDRISRVRHEMNGVSREEPQP